jgi:signal transduction histidine kinase
MFAQAPGFICFLRGPKHVFTLANDAYLQLVGAGRSLIGQEIRSALPEIEGQGFFELLDQVFASREPAFGHAAKVALRRTVDGSLEDRFVDFIYQPIVDAEGNVLGIFCQGNDVTERKRLEDERTRLLEAEQQARMDAEAANRLKDEFLATVSHELRTPLTAVLGWVQMLRSGRLPETSRARALETVERNARAQAKLIDDLLDVSRILSGKLNLELSVVSLAGPVEAALEAVRPAAEAKGVQLEASLDAELHVNGDPTRIQQMAWNLLANAVKFTPAGGRVTVALEDQGDAVELTVKDTGQGIAQAFLPHLFERFRQADARPSREHGGLGLGLSIVKHLVEAHGGTVSAESEGEGAGSTFRLRLPLAVRRADLGLTLASAALAGDASELTWPPSLKGLNVLVVDDEQDTRELLRELLEQVGMSVKTAASAGEGLELLTGTRPDILVADLAMPGEDGFSLIRQVRDLAPDLGGRTPAVALTAYARPEDRARVLLSGFKAHVPKPIEPKEFLAVLASLL